MSPIRRNKLPNRKKRVDQLPQTMEEQFAARILILKERSAGAKSCEPIGKNPHAIDLYRRVRCDIEERVQFSLDRENYQTAILALGDLAGDLTNLLCESNDLQLPNHQVRILINEL